MNAAELARWLERVELSVSCWTWTGPLRPDGYGVLTFGGRQFRAHRLAYEHFVGPIPQGLTLDHDCHTTDPTCPGGNACLHRRCVNPAHLVVMPNAKNVSLGHARAPKTHCPKGHPYDEFGGVRPDNGKRYCRKCAYKSVRASIARRRLRDPDFIRQEQERARMQYLRRRDEILARQRERRSTEQGHAKRHAEYLAQRPPLLEDDPGIGAEQAGRLLGIGRARVVRLATEDADAPADRLKGRRGITNGRRGWLFDPEEIERFRRISRPSGHRRCHTTAAYAGENIERRGV